MSADQQPPPAPAESILVRWATCTIGGAIAGIVVGVWAMVAEQGLNYWYSGTTLPNYIDGQIAIGAHQQYLDAWRIFGPAVPGVVGGLLSALFSRRMRHPIALASVWASILGSVGLVVVGMFISFDMLQTQPPGETLIMIAIYLATGAIFGFALGVSARLLERVLQRLRSVR